MARDNDAFRHEVEDMLALVQDQMSDLSTLRQERSKMIAKGSAADGAVEVTVDAQRLITDIVIDESYSDDFEFTELGDHIKTAARNAVEQMSNQVSSLMAPMAERRQALFAQPGMAVHAPEITDMLAGLRSFIDETAEPHANRDGSDG